ncbi:MAG: glycosyltransferase [Patescibacteria group bacterium]
MKVIHIIPAAFEYFDQIKSEAFKLVEDLYKLGIETEAVTLQYGNTSRRMEREVQKVASSHSLAGTENVSDIISSLEKFDIVHLHTPLFGLAGKILKWKVLHPEIPLLVTRHRNIITADLFSLLIQLYNVYYVPRLLKAADLVIDERKEKQLALDYEMAYNNLASKILINK